MSRKHTLNLLNISVVMVALLMGCGEGVEDPNSRNSQSGQKSDILAGQAATKCPGANPQGCVSTGCPQGQVCKLDSGCFASACACDSATGTWACTPDCNGGQCVAQQEPAKTCSGANPQGCASTGCPNGQVCKLDSGCLASACACDSATGTWICTPDCNGGQCVPK